MPTFFTDREAKINVLVAAKFPNVWQHKSIKSIFRENAAPTGQEVGEIVECKAYREELSGLSIEELTGRFSDQLAAIEASRWFHQPASDANYSYWAKA